MDHFYTPNQDASIYSFFPGINTGLDELIEVGKNNDGIDFARALVQFDLSKIISDISASIVPLSATYKLVLYVSTASQLKKYTTLELYQVSQSWEEGQGYFFQNIFNDATGVTWNSTTSGSTWDYPGATTGSLKIVSTASVPLGDFYIDVSPFVQSWLSGSFPNNGILIQFPSSSEQDPGDTGNIKFFSKDTHTIFQPELVVSWNSQTYLTASLTASSQNNTIILAQTMKPQYRQNEFVHIDLVIRDRYPIKTFDKFFDDWSGNRFPPSSSYFKIVDEQTGITVIPYSDSSRISVNNNFGPYIEFVTQQMYPLRYYRIYAKTVTSGSLEETFDLGFFKIIN